MSGTVPGTGIDPAIALDAKPPAQPNPLATIGQFAQAKNALNQLQMFPGRLEQQQIAIQQGQLANQGAQLHLHQQRLNYFGGLMVNELLGPDGKPTTGVAAKDIAKGLSTAVSDGMMPPKDAVTLLSSLPNGGADPAANRQWLIQHYGANQAASGQIGQALATLGQTPSSINTPAGTYTGGTAGPLTGAPGAFQPATMLPSTVAPSQAAAPETRVGPNGQPVTAPAGTYMPPGVVPPQAGGAGGGVVQLGGPGAGAPPEPGAPAVASAPLAPPPSPTNQPRLAGDAPPPALPGAGGAPFAGMPVGTGPALQASAAHYAAASEAANGYQQRVFPLEQAAAALQTASTGPGTGTIEHIKSFLVGQGVWPGGPNKVASYDEAVKYLAQWAARQPGASGSDMRTELSQVANPSTKISNLAARDVVRNALGLERMQQAAIQAFPGGAQNAGQYDQYQRTFATTHDPRGFVWNEVPYAERQKIISGMTRSQKMSLKASIDLAGQYDLTGKPPNAQQQPVAPAASVPGNVLPASP